MDPVLGWIVLCFDAFCQILRPIMGLYGNDNDSRKTAFSYGKSIF